MKYLDTNIFIRFLAADDVKKIANEILIGEKMRRAIEFVSYSCFEAKKSKHGKGRYD